MEKVTSFAKKRVLLAGAVAAAVALVGTKVLADDASDIEQFYPQNSAITYDNTSGDYPVITAIASQPGVFGGHTFTGWAIFAQDSTGSLELFSSAATLTNLTGSGAGTPYSASLSPAVGDAINGAGGWSPYDGIPEMTFTTTVASNNFLRQISTGNTVPTPPVFTISQLEAGTGNGAGVLTNPAIAGMVLTIQGVTISGSTGGFMSTFPLESQANVVDETYVITDGGGSTLEMFDWTTSYSVCAARGGSAVPTGTVNMTGFFDSFNEFVPLSIVSVPEPSTVVLVGTGLLGLLTLRRRKK